MILLDFQRFVWNSNIKSSHREYIYGSINFHKLNTPRSRHDCISLPNMALYAPSIPFPFFQGQPLFWLLPIDKFHQFLYLYKWKIFFASGFFAQPYVCKIHLYYFLFLLLCRFPMSKHTTILLRDTEQFPSFVYYD